MSEFKLTYASMFDPPEELHTLYDAALPKVKASTGKTHGMIINNKNHFSNETFDNHSPINTDWLLARLPQGTAEDAERAIAAARDAFPKWSAMNWRDRVRLVRGVADLIERRIYELAVATTLNVGKNRLESLGDIQE